jgi:hypothetical protein
LIDEIKQKATTWKPREAHLNPLSNKSYEEIRNMVGTILGEDANMETSEPTILEAVPATFDART